MQGQMLRHEKIERGIDTLVCLCAQVKKGERVLIIVDKTTKEVGKALFKKAGLITDSIKLVISKSAKMHGREPSLEIANEMRRADVIFGVTRFSLAHTKARLCVTNKGARYLSLPDYDVEQLGRASLGVDFLKLAPVAKRIKKCFDDGKKITIYTPKGAEISLDIKGRRANYCPGFCDKSGMMGSPPDIEVNIAPVETKSEGLIVVDGSIPCQEIGLVEKDIKIHISKGLIKKIDTRLRQGKILAKILEIDQNHKRGMLAEFGIGLNPGAELCGRMLEDEGCLGTAHFGFGSNFTIGGQNKVDFHLDFVFCQPTILVDNKLIMREGIFNV